MPLSAELTVRRDDGERTFEVRAAAEVADGETLALLGPNGAGKSTLLEALAGLVPLADGRIELDGVRIEALAPERRRIGLAFQDGALFPRMSVRENVAFGLRAIRVPRAEARRRADALLAAIAPGVDPAATPGRLSGGERQRVALARALATAPRLLLLDEPLAAVDVGARPGLRAALREVIRSFEGPCVLVAHDPVDALTLADRVAIVEDGRVVQTGTPEDIRRAPRTPYAADLVGVNLFRGSLTPIEGGAGVLATGEGEITVAWPGALPHRPLTAVLATVRPADVALHVERPEGSPRNVLRGVVAEVVIEGDRARVRLGTSPPVVAEVTSGSIERLGIAVGRSLWASFKAVEVHVEAVEPSDAPPGTLGG